MVKEIGMKFKPLDIISIAYFVIISLLIVWGRQRVELWQAKVAAYLGLVGLVFLLSWSETRFAERHWFKFIRLGYPLLAVLFIYKGISGHVLLLHGRFLDPEITGLEKILLGVNPTLALERFVFPPLTEFFKFAYFSYYSYVAIPPLLLYFQKRYPDLERFVFTTALTFYVSFLGFILLPLEGPCWFFEQVYEVKRLTGFIFTPLQDFIMTHGAARGACFPSSHLAVAWVALFLIRKLFGSRYFWIVFPFTLSMTVAIVYNRYHYASDAAAGILAGFICYQISRVVCARFSPSG